MSARIPKIENVVSNRYPGLDGLRALALFAVFIHHYNPWPTSSIVSAIASQGYCGVQIFFVLSGFLITGILWDSRHRTHKLRDFYARRVLRIFPLYYAFWLIVFLLTPLLHWNWNWRWSLYLVHLGNYARFLFYNPNNLYWLDTLNGRGHVLPHFYLGHLWSLCIEEQFYFVWPWLVYVCSTRERLRSLCIGTVLLAPLLRVLSTLYAPTHLLTLELIYRSTPTQMDALAMGGLLAVLLRGSEGDFLRKHNGVIAMVLVSICVMYWATCFAVYGRAMSGTNTNLAVHFGLPAMDLLGVAAVLRASHAGSELEKLLAWKPVAAFGALTYGFYILHDPPHLFYLKLAAHFIGPRHSVPLLTAVIAFLTTLILSTLSFRFFETPILRLKRYFGHQTHHAVST